MGEKILVLDDEKEIADLVALYLNNEGYDVKTFYHAPEALAYIEHESIDLAVIDVMMPEMDGFTLCARVRESHHFPIIMLTAKGEEIDKISGLTLGADDYVTKPFRPLELVARIKAQLRRYKRYNMQPEQTEEILRVGGLAIHIRTHQCILNDVELALTPTEFTILQILMEQQGGVVSAEELFRTIWADEYYDKNNNTITVHIRHLREKLGESLDQPGYIKTVWGVGYKVEAK